MGDEHEQRAAGGDGDGEPGATGVRRCDYCRLPCPGEPITVDYQGITYGFCSDACHDALEESDRVFTSYHGFRRLDPMVTALNAGLPQGVPRNSFVLLRDLAGTRSEALQAELAWRALQRGEPVVYVSFLEPPVSVIQGFVSMEWNVLPALESGQLHLLDCFTYRMADRQRMFDRMDDWNRHLAAVAEEATTTVRDPTATEQIQSQLDDCLEALGMNDTGVVVIDSLTELGTLVQPVRAYNFVKDVRADVSKGRFVPVFAGATVTGNGEGESFPHDLGYMVDGVVDMRLNGDHPGGGLIKQMRIRKMNGVLTYARWHAYEYTSGQGSVVFDPAEQMAAADGEADAGSEGSDGASDLEG
ncbi:recombinase RecA [Halobacteriales archaeon QS_1_68_17]|nr:MAG: recombinase RecA [Halobacteriales archaeon QS_1_68_17]